MDAQTYLNQHQQLSHLIRHDVDCLEYLNDSLLNIPSPSSSRSSIHASPGEDALYVRTLESIDQKKFELAQKKELMARLENQIGEALDQMRFLNDRWAVDYVMFLRHRFLMHEKWEDVANAVWFLGSDESKNVTGAELIVDGGMSSQLYPQLLTTLKARYREEES